MKRPKVKIMSRSAGVHKGKLLKLTPVTSATPREDLLTTTLDFELPPPVAVRADEGVGTDQIALIFEFEKGKQVELFELLGGPVQRPKLAEMIKAAFKEHHPTVPFATGEVRVLADGSLKLVFYPPRPE